MTVVACATECSVRRRRGFMLELFPETRKPRDAAVPLRDTAVDGAVVRAAPRARDVADRAEAELRARPDETGEGRDPQGAGRSGGPAARPPRHALTPCRGGG